MMNYYNYLPNPVFNVINQQYLTGCNFGQQGMYAEQMNNLWAAMQSYDRAIACIEQSIYLAQQSGMSIYSQVYYNLALAHFSGARVKYALGYGTAFQSHCQQAQYALNRAMAINPDLAQSIPNITQPPTNNHSEPNNTIETMNNLFKMLDTAFKAANSFQELWQ